MNQKGKTLVDRKTGAFIRSSIHLPARGRRLLLRLALHQLQSVLGEPSVHCLARLADLVKLVNKYRKKIPDGYRYRTGWIIHHTNVRIGIDDRYNPTRWMYAEDDARKMDDAR